MRVLRDTGTEAWHAVWTGGSIDTRCQQARFRLLEEIIEQRKLDLLMRAQDKRRLNKPAPR